MIPIIARKQILDQLPENIMNYYSTKTWESRTETDVCLVEESSKQKQKAEHKAFTNTLLRIHTWIKIWINNYPTQPNPNKKGQQSLQRFGEEGPETWSRCSRRALKMSLSLRF